MSAIPPFISKGKKCHEEVRACETAVILTVNGEHELQFSPRLKHKYDEIL